MKYQNWNFADGKLIFAQIIEWKENIVEKGKKMVTSILSFSHNVCKIQTVKIMLYKIMHF